MSLLKPWLLLAALIAFPVGAVHAVSHSADSANSRVDTRDAEIAIESPTTVQISDGGTRSYGEVVVNGSNVTFPFVIRNDGGATLTGISLGISGTGASQFAVVTAAAATVGPGGSTLAEVRFLPTTAGAKTALLRITSNDANENPYDITLTGTGLALPGVPMLTSPGTKTAPSGAPLTTLTPNFSWKAATSATGYQLAIIRSADDAVIYTNSTLGAVTTLVLPEGYLQGGMVYRWTLRSSSALGQSAESQALHFTVAEVPTVPTAPKLLAPGGSVLPGKLVASLTPSFTWAAVPGALGHEIDVVNQTSNVPFRASNLPAAATFTIAAGALEAGQLYRWRVRARNAAGSGAWSPTWYFETVAATPPPAAPVLVSPGSTTSPGTVLPSLTPSLGWTAVAGATGYDVYVRNISDSVGAVFEENLSPSSTQFDVPAGRLLAGKTYYWNVRVTTAAGRSNFAARRFFQTAAAPPAPVITSVERPSLVGSDAVQLVQLTGTDFRSGAKVWLWSTNSSTPKAVTTVVVSDTLVVARVITSKIAATWSAQVRNSDGQVSNTATFDVVAPVATLLPPKFYLSGSNSPITSSSVAFDQPKWIRISDDNAPAIRLIRYTLDGTLPNETSATLNPLLGEGLVLLGATAKTILTAICTGIADSPSAPTKLTLNFNLPTLTLPTSGTLVGPAMTVPNAGEFYLKLIVPVGIANYHLSSDGRSPYSFFLAKGRLPTLIDYDHESESTGSPLKDRLDYLLGDAGTYFVRVAPTVGAESRGALAALVAKQLTKPSMPIIRPGGGAGASPLKVTMDFAWSGDEGQIYYTVDGTDPQPSRTVGGATSIYTGPIYLLASAKIRAVVSSRQGTSAVAKADVAVTTSTFATALPWVEQDIAVPGHEDLSHYTKLKCADVSLSVSWSAGKVPSYQQFYFDVPEDPLPGVVATKVEYPVAIVAEHRQLHAGTLAIYVKAGAPAKTTDIKLTSLPSVDYVGGDARVLGTIYKSKGFDLVPGTRYYLLFEVGGLTHMYGEEAALLDVKFTLHTASLASATAAPITPNLANTWLVAHGRTNTSETPRIVEQSEALAEAISPGRVGQVLRLNWGTMANTGLSGLPHADAVFTKPVGQRTGAVLRKLGLSSSKLSLTGHSWGTHVSYSLAADGSAKGAGKVQRLVACDPAQFWIHESPSFSAVANKSWSFVSQSGLYGHEGLASTATEAFILNVGVWADLGGDDTDATTSQVDVHAAPFDLFTLFLRSNYKAAFVSPIDSRIWGKFGIEQLDAQPTSWYRENRWPVTHYPLLFDHYGIFEAQIDAILDGDGLDETLPVTLRYKDTSSKIGADMTLP